MILRYDDWMRFDDPNWLNFYQTKRPKFEKDDFKTFIQNQNSSEGSDLITNDENTKPV